MRYVVFDLETTGLSPEANEIIQIAAYKVNDGVTVDRFTTYVQPIMYIPVTIQSMTGITMEMVKDAELANVVLPEFFDWCEELPLVGHNVNFDYRFLLVKGNQCGVDFSLDNQRLGACTLNLARKWLKLDNYKLQTVADALGVSLKGEAHHAEYDAMLTKLCFDRFLLKEPSFKFEKLVKDADKYGRVLNNDTLSFE